MNQMEEIWQKFENRLRAFTMSKVNDKSVTDDIMQELFIRIHANIDMVKDETRIQSWIYQICRNLIIDHFRNRDRAMRIADPFNTDLQETGSDDIMAEAIADMVKMMDNLPPEYCEALCLTELGKMNQKEYADRIGISYSGAKSRVQRARHMLKDMLMKCCHYEFDKYGTVINIYPAGCCCCHK